MPNDTPHADPAADPHFVRRTLIVIGLATLVVAVALLLWNAVDIFLLAFAGVLLATFLNTPARFVSDRTAVPHGLALAGVLLLLLLLVVGTGFLAGPSIGEQATQLFERLPASVEELRDGVEGLPGGAWVLERMPSGDDATLAGSGLVSSITGTASMFWDGLAKLLFVFFLGLYLAASPRTYRNGLATLIPPARRERGLEILNRIGRVLQGWILGQLVSMVLVGSLTFLGLSLLGIPLALILGIIAGSLEFVPIVGPFLAFVPAALLAFTQGPTAALWVVVLYVVIQQIEGQIIVPLVQKRAIDLPPALTIGAVFVGGAAFGPVGLLVATPLAAVLLVLVEMIYRHDLLGEHVQLPGGGEE